MGGPSGSLEGLFFEEEDWSVLTPGRKGKLCLGRYEFFKKTVSQGERCCREFSGKS